jgi:tRNA pseudouridine32 synthase / 23S rRNA pseudouridine746 synthase
MSGLQVLFEDSRLIAVDKPAGQAVIPGRGLEEEPLVEQVARRLGGKAFVVHRLDRDASGLTLFAKDAATHRELCLLFETRRMGKTYLAAVLGRVEADGRVEQPLRLFGSGRMGVAAGGKPSRTSYRVRARGPHASLLEVSPETGRRHQIRVHLHSLGHPVLGDALYGRPRPVGGAPRLMLHSWRLAFVLAGSPYRLAAEPDAQFQRVLGLFGLSSG